MATMAGDQVFVDSCILVYANLARFSSLIAVLILVP